jgi:glycosyltransferase involved in cell wall biosynthesis
LVVLFVGKLTSTKNVDLLLRAFQRVHQQRSDAVLWIVGDGPDRPRLENLVRESDIPSVHFLGEISEPRAINSIYMTADVFGLPGTGGLALNQAMTFGKPVVVSSADGTEEDLVIDGQNGLYFEPNNAEDLAQKLLLLLSDDSRRASMGKRAREVILHSINMTQMLNSFCDAIFAHHPAPP